MTEIQVGYLCKAAASLPESRNNRCMTLLKSYYLMRCKDITKGYGLPEKHFSQKVRCPYCCTPWKSDTIIKVSSIKLNKKQRYRIRHAKETKSTKEYIKNKKNLLNSNRVEQICSLCKQSTFTIVVKPETIKHKSYKHKQVESTTFKMVKEALSKKKDKISGILNNKTDNKKAEINVYSTTTDVFSLNSSSNNISKPQEPKVIKNNKKKKDKFAGLCQKAVLATMKLKEEKGKNKLNQFLKPSSAQ